MQEVAYAQHHYNKPLVVVMLDLDAQSLLWSKMGSSARTVWDSSAELSTSDGKGDFIFPDDKLPQGQPFSFKV